MKIVDGYSGEAKFIKGRGRRGNTKLDKYQKMLLKAERTNGFEHEPKQKPLTAKQLKERGWVKPKTLNQSIRWK